jgi:Holliday junction resolvase
MSRAERDKGARGEREVAAVLRAHGLAVDRTIQQSGIYLRGDLTGVPGYHFEVKRQEALRLPLWLRQVSRDAPPGSTPVLAFRQSNEQWYAVLALADLAKLLDLARLSP